MGHLCPSSRSGPVTRDKEGAETNRSAPDTFSLSAESCPSTRHCSPLLTALSAFRRPASQPQGQEYHAASPGRRFWRFYSVLLQKTAHSPPAVQHARGQSRRGHGDLQIIVPAPDPEGLIYRSPAQARARRRKNRGLKPADQALCPCRQAETTGALDGWGPARGEAPPGGLAGRAAQQGSFRGKIHRREWGESLSKLGTRVE